MINLNKESISWMFHEVERTSVWRLKMKMSLWGSGSLGLVLLRQLQHKPLILTVTHHNHAKKEDTKQPGERSGDTFIRLESRNRTICRSNTHTHTQTHVQIHKHRLFPKIKPCESLMWNPRQRQQLFCRRLNPFLTFTNRHDEQTGCVRWDSV